jgi:hypothetical protein
MTKRRHLLVFGPLVVWLALGVSGWMLWPRAGITRENAAKIQVGMTLEEVEAILGGPARDETTGPVVPDMRRDTAEQENAADLAEAYIHMYQKIHAKSGGVWQSDDVLIYVRLHDGWITGSHHIHVCREHESPIEIVRRWLHL